MKKLNLKESAKLLPHGSITEISFDTRISQSTISRIIRGENLNGADRVKNKVLEILLRTKKEIESVLSGIENE